MPGAHWALQIFDIFLHDYFFYVSNMRNAFCAHVYDYVSERNNNWHLYVRLHIT